MVVYSTLFLAVSIMRFLEFESISFALSVPGATSFEISDFFGSINPVRKQSSNPFPVSAWESDLASENQASILRALSWIGGRHLNPKQGDHLQDQIDESLHEIQAVRAVRASPRVVNRIKELQKNDNRWIREAADLPRIRKMSLARACNVRPHAAIDTPA